MKHIYTLAAVCVSLVLPSWLNAQMAPESHSPYTLNHAEVGVFADYFRFAPSNAATNFVGIGGRVGFNVNPYIALEGTMNYDFARNYTTTYSSGTGASATTTFVKSSVRPLTGLFGPKFQIGTGSAFRLFATGKIGFINFTTNNSGVVSGSTFTGAVSSVPNSGTHLALYPGGGFETFAGPIGLRAEAGDEIYLNNGTYNNLRVAVGPVFRF